jgi:uncharacterized protein YjiS (DUF1127 family)
VASYVIICDVQAQKHSFYTCIKGWHIRLADEPPDSQLFWRSDMTHFAPGTSSGSTFTLALAGIAVRTVKRTFAALKSRHQIAQLSDLDDRALKDIGLIRSDVHAALAEPLFRDPSHHLMDVAGHKRSPSRQIDLASGATPPVNGMGRLRRDDAAVMPESMKTAAC